MPILYNSFNDSMIAKILSYCITDFHYTPQRQNCTDGFRKKTKLFAASVFSRVWTGLFRYGLPTDGSHGDDLLRLFCRYAAA